MTPAEAALHEHATETEDGRWWFSSPAHTHKRESALAIAEMCLMLDIPVTDLLSADSWLKIMRRIVNLEERVAGLERGYAE